MRAYSIAVARKNTNRNHFSTQIRTKPTENEKSKTVTTLIMHTSPAGIYQGAKVRYHIKYCSRCGSSHGCTSQTPHLLRVYHAAKFHCNYFVPISCQLCTGYYTPVSSDHTSVFLSVQCNVQHWTEYKTTLASIRCPSGVRPPGDYGQHCESSLGPIFTKFGT